MYINRNDPQLEKTSHNKERQENWRADWNDLDISSGGMVRINSSACFFNTRGSCIASSSESKS